MKTLNITMLFHYLDSGIVGKDMFLVSKYLGGMLDANVDYVFPKAEHNKQFSGVYRGVNMIPIRSKSKYEATIWSEKEMFWYLIRNAKKIDVLQLFWMNRRNLVFSWVYKKINPTGIVYIKADMNSVPVMGDSLKGWIKGMLYKSIDILSVETKNNYDEIKAGCCGDYLKNVVEWMPNGHDSELRQNLHVIRKGYDKKENLIITVGRLGSKQKNTQMLLDAVAKCNLRDYKVVLIGPVEHDFEPYVNKYFKDNPRLAEKVLFTGPIYDKKELWEWYNRAKIFCLTSTFECMAQVYSEALAFGNYILTTPVTGAKEITDNEELGKFIAFDSSTQLSNELQKLIDDDSRLKNTIPKAFKLSDEVFNWPSLVVTISDKIKKIIKNREK
ncbi:glycosyltransferase family 4 protein [uncultured Duncaniella sp.]|uniref:glycosyltransferase family 4 protein n=1 Tax=uncultured Duncaniella sp. TaxID=2768039 RepID=UPI002730B2FB|nr:glycosyltransferase [uncultured Duncaniella sp.]